MYLEIKKLYNYLKDHSNQNFDFLLRLASYDKVFREDVERLAKKNPLPFKEWFDGKNRIYFPFKKEDDEKIDAAVKDILSEYGYTITNYIEGYCEKDGRTYRIGKVINDLKLSEMKDAFDEFDKKEINEKWVNINNQFLNSAYRAGKQFGDNLTIVISQDPHDIAKMSYGRRWTSCKNIALDGGFDGEVIDTRDSVFCEIEEGGLIAYLTSNNDLNIENPIARIAIRRFVNSDGDSIALAEKTVYGIEIPGFYDFVSKWLQEKNKSILDKDKNKVLEIYTIRGDMSSDTFNTFEILTPGLSDLQFNELIDLYKNSQKNIKFFYLKDRYFDELADAYDDINFMSDPEIYACMRLMNATDGILYTKNKEIINNFLRFLKEEDRYDDWVSILMDHDEYSSANPAELIANRFQEGEKFVYMPGFKKRIADLLLSKYFDLIPIDIIEDMLYFYISSVYDEQFESKDDSRAEDGFDFSIDFGSSHIDDNAMKILNKYPNLISTSIFIRMSTKQRNLLVLTHGEEKLKKHISGYNMLLNNALNDLSSKHIRFWPGGIFAISAQMRDVFTGPTSNNNIEVAKKILLNNLVVEENLNTGNAKDIFPIIQIILKDIDAHPKLRVSVIKKILLMKRTLWRRDRYNIYNIIKYIHKIKISKEELQSLLDTFKLLFNNAEIDCSANREYLGEYSPTFIVQSKEEKEKEKDAEVEYRKKFLSAIINKISA